MMPIESLPAEIASLFERHAALCGFSVRGSDETPDSCPRGEDDDPLFVGDFSVAPGVGAREHDEIFREVLAALSELLSARPEAAEILRGRTFARVLH
jgi:hypothetical protein